MKFATDRSFADPEKSARKLVELANTVETIMDGRVLIELINLPSLREKRQPRRIPRRRGARLNNRYRAPVPRPCLAFAIT